MVKLPVMLTKGDLTSIRVSIIIIYYISLSVKIIMKVYDICKATHLKAHFYIDYSSYILNDIALL